MKKKISVKEIEEGILEILDKSNWYPLSIREITLRLKEKYDIRLSQAVVKMHLFKLRREGKLE